MAIELHGTNARTRLRKVGCAAAGLLHHLAGRVRPGVTTADIDRWAREEIRRIGARSSQLGYKGFPASVCTSPNAVVCHGIPSPKVRLTHGDMVNIDVTIELDGYHGDTSTMVLLPGCSNEFQHVASIAERALHKGIEAARPGGRLGDIGAAIEALAEGEGCSVVRQYGGHGIGRRMHMAPHVDHHGPAGRGPRLRPGMAFTVEPMVTLGDPPLRVLDDGWTVVTADGTPSAQFEHTLLVTETGVETLTTL